MCFKGVLSLGNIWMVVTLEAVWTGSCGCLVVGVKLILEDVLAFSARSETSKY